GHGAGFGAGSFARATLCGIPNFASAGISLPETLGLGSGLFAGAADQPWLVVLGNGGASDDESDHHHLAGRCVRYEVAQRPGTGILGATRQPVAAAVDQPSAGRASAAVDPGL